MKKILLLREPKNAKVQEIFDLIGYELRQYDWMVSFKDPSHAHSPAGFMGILIGTSDNMNRSENQTLGWIRKYGKVLTQKPTALFSVGSLDIEVGPSRILTPRRKIVADTLSDLGCAPRLIEIFNEKTEEADIRRFAIRFAEYINSHSTEKSKLRRPVAPFETRPREAFPSP